MPAPRAITETTPRFWRWISSNPGIVLSELAIATAAITASPITATAPQSSALPSMSIKPRVRSSTA